MHIAETALINTPPSVVWDQVTDPGWYRRAFAGIAHWEPQGGSIQLGERIDLRVQVGAAPVGGLIEIVTFEPGRELAWIGQSGVIGSGAWRLSEPTPGVTSVSLLLSYRVTGAFGGVVERLAAPMVQRVVKAALDALRPESEGAGREEEGQKPPAPPTSLGPVRSSLVLARAGLLRPSTLSALARSGRDLVRTGLTPAGAYAYGAARWADRPAVIDDAGSWTFAEMHRRVESLAGALAGDRIGPETPMGVLCRNHRGFVEAVAALSRLGSDVVLLNTSFAAPQVLQAVRSHGIRGMVLDEEFLARAEAAPVERYLAWSEPGRPAGPRLDDLDAASNRSLPRSPRQGSRYVLLTSGTTGAPRSAARPVPLSLDPVVSVLSRIPLQAGDGILIASPLFHALGFGFLGLCQLLCSTVVLQRTFDPESTLAAVQRHRVRALVVVPLMIKRLLELPAARRDQYDTSSLRAVISSGSALSGDLAARFMDRYGECVYNVYGSTEAAWATIARPEDLRAAPGTVGRPAPGANVRVVDLSGADTAVGVTGRVVVANELSVVTDGSSAEGDLVDTGDLGHLDGFGRLFIDGRRDDMIVSGGENVYPQPVEDVLIAHPAILDVAVVGVPDPEFGQRLRALVVRGPGSQLTPEEVRHYVQARLPRYSIPRDVVFVDSLPHNETGKTLHNLLRA